MPVLLIHEERIIVYNFFPLFTVLIKSVNLPITNKKNIHLQNKLIGRFSFLRSLESNGEFVLSSIGHKI